MSLTSITDLCQRSILNILQAAEMYDSQQAHTHANILQGRSVVLAFFENSTRTKSSFAIAASRLGAFPLWFESSSSSIGKGESIEDTARTLNAYNPLCIVIRHPESGFCHLVQRYSNCPIVNAGDGANEHPSQALIDLSVIKTLHGRVDGLKVVFCGDVLHSRVAHSNIKLLKMFNNEIRLVSPPGIGMQHIKEAKHFSNLPQALDQVDVIFSIRPQFERMKKTIAISPAEYRHCIQLKEEHLKYASPKVVLLHPGPITINTELSGGLVERNWPVFELQARRGLAIRQAIFAHILNEQHITSG